MTSTDNENQGHSTTLLGHVSFQEFLLEITPSPSWIGSLRSSELNSVTPCQVDRCQSSYSPNTAANYLLVSAWWNNSKTHNKIHQRKILSIFPFDRCMFYKTISFCITKTEVFEFLFHDQVLTANSELNLISHVFYFEVLPVQPHFNARFTRWTFLVWGSLCGLPQLFWRLLASLSS